MVVSRSLTFEDLYPVIVRIREDADLHDIWTWLKVRTAHQRPCLGLAEDPYTWLTYNRLGFRVADRQLAMEFKITWG